MLQVDRANFEQFDGNDLANLLLTGGWEAVMPNALQDSHLLCVAEQLRGLLSGQDADRDEQHCSVGLILTILLFSRARPDSRVIGETKDIELATLHEAMSLLSFSVDREIASRVLNQRDDQSGVALVRAMEKLTRRRKARRTRV